MCATRGSKEKETMGQTGRMNTALGINALVKAIRDIRTTVEKARADGHITKEEALEIFIVFVGACIKEGLAVAIGAAGANDE